LSRWCLAFEVRPEFQLLPKIQREAIRLILALNLDLESFDTGSDTPAGLSEDE